MKKWMAVTAIAVLASMGLAAVASAQGPGPARGMAGHAWLWSELVDAVGDESGLTDAEVRQAAREGATLTEVCAASACDLDAVRAQATAEAESMLALAVENGRLTQAEADAWLAGLPNLIETALTSTRPLRDLLGGAMLERQANRELVRTVHLMAGLTRVDWQDALDQDLTLAALAEQAGLDEADVVAQALVHLENRLQVSLDRERITQDEMDAALAAAAESYPSQMQQPVSELEAALWGRGGQVGERRGDGLRGGRGSRPGQGARGGSN